MRRLFVWLLFGAGILVAETAAASEPEWRTLRGRIVPAGVLPPPADMVVDKDNAICGPKRQPDESLLVDEGIANVFVWLAPEKDQPAPKVHPDLKVADQLVLKIEGCRFQPHALVAHTGQEVAVRNVEPIGHNPYYDSLRNKPTSTTIPAAGNDVWKFPNVESMPMPVVCAIHPWMSAYILVQDHPYATVTDRNGVFVIKNLPAGEHRFRFWHERSRFFREGTIAGKQEPLTRGLRIDLSGADVDLGEIHVAAELFKR